MIDQTVNGSDELDPNPADAKLREQIAAVKRERSRLAAEREARLAEKALSEKLAAEELALRNEAAIAAAEAEHGEIGKAIAIVECSSGVVIVRRPHHVAFRQFQDKGKYTIQVCEQLVRPALVHPDPDTFDRWAEKESAIIVRAANACAGLHGSSSEEVAGKY